jgi:hypothetical protein
MSKHASAREKLTLTSGIWICFVFSRKGALVLACSCLLALCLAWLLGRWIGKTKSVNSSVSLERESRQAG